MFRRVLRFGKNLFHLLNDLWMLLRDVVRPGDVILVKGSRRIGLEAVVAALTTTKAARRAAARG